MKEKLDDMIYNISFLNEEIFRNLPNCRLLSELHGWFIKYNLPVKYIGKIKINVNEDFWVDESKANQFLDLYVKSFMYLKNFLVYEFGCYWEQIFADVLSRASIDF